MENSHARGGRGRQSKERVEQEEEERNYENDDCVDGREVGIERRKVNLRVRGSKRYALRGEWSPR